MKTINIKVNGKNHQLEKLGQNGHPIILSPKLRNRIIRQAPVLTLRDVVKEVPCQKKKKIYISDIRILQNMNTPLERKQWEEFLAV